MELSGRRNRRAISFRVIYGTQMNAEKADQIAKKYEESLTFENRAVRIVIYGNQIEIRRCLSRKFYLCILRVSA